MIFFETAHQASVFLLLLYAGMAAGLMYDIVSLLRWKCIKALAILMDAAFFLCVGVLCFFSLARGGEKSLRVYALLGVLCGAGIYSLGVRRLFLAIAGKIGKICERRLLRQKPPPAPNRKPALDHSDNF